MSDFSLHRGPLLGFDLETTGVDTESARIVSAALVAITPGVPGARTTLYLADPGVEIPAGAAAVHGITTAYAREHGYPARDVVYAVVAALSAAHAAGTPVVTHNGGGYDTTVLDREARRHGFTPPVFAPLVDTLVLDKELAPRRRGPGARKLTNLSVTYGVPLSEEAAHAADADALACLRIFYKMCVAHPELAALSAADLHEMQGPARAEQQVSLQAYLRRSGRDPDAVCSTHWPVAPPPGLDWDPAYHPNETDDQERR